MENIINELAEKKGNALSKKIDDYAFKVFKIPGWMVKHLFICNIYAKIFRFEIRQHNDYASMEYNYEFFRLGKKVGELKISDLELMKDL